MQKLITLPEGTTEFVANGVTYYVEDLISIARYRYFRRFQNEIATGLTHFDMVQLIKNNVKNLNGAMGGEKVLADMAYENINALNHCSNLEEKEPFEVWICTLFVNTKDEDRRIFDLPAMQEKIKNWETEGIDMGFFTNAAESLLGVPAGAFRSPILGYLETQPELQSRPSESAPENNPVNPPTA